MLRKDQKTAVIEANRTHPDHGRLFVLTDHGKFHLSKILPKGLRSGRVKPRPFGQAVSRNEADGRSVHIHAG